MTAAFLWHWFDFPDGSVLTNLIASAVCVGLAGWKLFRKLHRMHQHMLELHDDVRLTHDQVKQVHEHQLAHAPKATTRKRTP